MIDVPVGVRKRTGPRASLHLITADALRSAPRRSEKECNLIGFEAFYKWNGSSWGHLSSGEVEWFILGTSLIWSWTLEEFRSVLWIVIVLHGWVAVGTGRVVGAGAGADAGPRGVIDVAASDPNLGAGPRGVIDVAASE